VASLLAALTVGFSMSPASPDALYMRRWSYEASGLRNGLGFAVEPDFCAKLMPSFAERDWLQCDYLQTAMLRAFESWSINHQDISFVNVSEACAVDPAVVACMADPNRTDSTPSPPAPPPSPPSTGNSTSSTGAPNSSPGPIGSGNCTKLCSAAQIFVLAEDLMVLGTERTIGEPAQAGIFKSVGLTAASNEKIDSVAKGSAPAYSTSGVYADADPSIGKATITFNQGQCFYLDSTFCFGMHEIEANGTNVLVLFSLLMMPILACAIATLIGRCCYSLHTLCQCQNGPVGAVLLAIHDLSTPVWLTWFMIASAIIAPYVYFNIAEPCVRCFDFEASFVHYVGKTLGLTDPSFATSASYDSFRVDQNRCIDACPQDEIRCTATACTTTACIDACMQAGEPFADYELTGPLTKANCVEQTNLRPGFNGSLAQRTNFTASPLGAGPVMVAPTRTRAERCLALDDLHGLNYLYPTCSLTRQSAPMCVESQSNLGLLRFFLIVVVGIVSAFIVAACLSSGTGCLVRRNDLQHGEEQAFDSKVAAATPAAPYPSVESAASNEVLTRPPPEPQRPSATPAAGAAPGAEPGREVLHRI